MWSVILNGSYELASVKMHWLFQKKITRILLVIFAALLLSCVSLITTSLLGGWPRRQPTLRMPPSSLESSLLSTAFVQVKKQVVYSITKNVFFTMLVVLTQSWGGSLKWQHRTQRSRTGK